MKAFKRQDVLHPAAARRLPAFLRPGDSVEDQAAAWSDALRDDGADDPGLRRAFRAWCAADPDRERIFAETDRAYRLARAAGGSHALDAMEADILRRAARRRRRRQWAAGGTGLAASALIALTLVLDIGWSDVRQLPERAYYALSGDSLYRTEIGERLAVSLDDGSHMTLNTDSRAVVRYRDGVRGIALTRGQALFEVARTENRPFVVTAGDRKITALGTRFDVRLTDRRFEVTLLEGKVSVEDTEPEADSSRVPSPESRVPNPQSRSSRTTNNEQRTTVLQPGQQFVVATAGSMAPVIRPIDTQRVTSWREGQVIFENDPLDEAVDEINRYAKRRVVLADDRLGDMRLSGAFNTNNTRVFVDMLTVHLPVTVVETADNRIVLGYNGG